MLDKSKTVCFSGHRKIYDPICDIENSLNKEIRSSIDAGMVNFIAGGAIGFDTMAARAVIGLRDVFPQIKLFLALPCPEKFQTMKWNEKQKKDYRDILSRADEVIVLSEKYTNECMLIRNHYMVDNSNSLICYLRREWGGTLQTLRYAMQKHINIIRI